MRSQTVVDARLAKQRQSSAMANPDRLTALDSTFLHLEDHSHGAHARRVGDGLRGQGADARRSSSSTSLSRLHLVPRYRQRLAYVPLGQGRPVWTDDPHFNPYYHIRHTALPQARPTRRRSSGSPGGCSPSAWTAPSRCGRSGSCSSMAGERFALIAKTHHALVDGISGVDITTVLFDTAPRAAPPLAPARAVERQAAARAGEAARRGAARALDRARRDGARRARAAARARAARSRRCARALVERRRDDARRHQRRRRRRARSTSTSARTAATRSSTPTSAQFKAIKDSLGGTLNDVVLAVGQPRARALPAPRRATTPTGLVLKAMVPVSVRADAERGALGNQVAAMWAPLPVGVEDPAECLQQVAPGDGGPQELRPGGGRAGADQPRRLRAADDPQPGRAPAGAPALLQPRRHERARARSSRSTCSGAPAGALPGRAARAPPGAGDRGDELRRPPRLRPARRLRRAARARADRATT